MAGFNGASGVPKKYVDDQIASATASVDVYLSSTDNTIEAIYNTLSRIPRYHSATLYALGTVTSILTGGKLTNAVKGVVNHVETSIYDFFVVSPVSGNLSKIYTWRVSSLTSSAITAGTVYRYDGTEV